MREFDLRQPICEYLLERDYFPAVEFWLHNAITDIVAGSYELRVGRSIPRLRRTVAVELKLERVGEVLEQAKANASRCDWSYAAMPTRRIERMRASTFERFKQLGVGLLQVGEDGTTREVIRPVHQGSLSNDSREAKQLWRRVRKLHKERMSDDNITRP